MHIMNFQWVQELMNQHYDKKVYFLDMEEKIDIYIKRLTDKFNSEKNELYWPSMLTEIMCIANAANIQLADSFLSMGYKIDSITEIKPHYLVIVREGSLDKEMFQCIITLKEEMSVYKSEQRISKDFMETLAIAVMVIVQATAMRTPDGKKDKAQALTFMKYIDYILQHASQNMFFNYIQKELTSNNTVFSSVVAWKLSRETPRHTPSDDQRKGLIKFPCY